MEATTRNYDDWIGHDVYDAEGDKIGEIRDIFYDDVTQRPEWLAVKTGLFGGANTFVPIQGSTRYGDEDLQVTYTKDFIKAAPNMDADGSLTPMQEQELWQYYEYDYATTTKKENYGYTKNWDRNRVDKDYNTGWRQDWKRGDHGPVIDQRTDQSEVVAEATVRNEQVSKTEQPETVRLRKYQWTENVPVQHEEVRVEGQSAGQSRGATQTQTRPSRDA